MTGCEKFGNISEELQDTKGKEAVSLLNKSCYTVMNEGNSVLDKQFESFKRKVDSLLQTRRNVLTSYAEKAENYYKEMTEYQEQKEKLRIEILKKEEWCDKEKKTCDEVHEEICKTLEEISFLEHKMEREKKRDKELQKLVEAGEPADEKAMELNKALGYFQQNLALKVKRTDIDGELVFTFTHVDCNDRDQEFEFGVKVVEDTYVLTRCEPTVSNIKQLLKTLNETNDLQSFVCAVRDAFKESCMNKKC